MMARAIGITSLPNEILIPILSSFQTRTLLSLTLISHHFHDVILHIIHRRLLEAASHKDHKLILECYHPSAKFYTPYLFCEYLGTPDLDGVNQGFWTHDRNSGNLGKLSKVYSYFRPLRLERHPRSLWPHPTAGRITLPQLSFVGKHKELVCQDVNLDSYEQFSQLVTNTNLIKLGPKKGVFMSSATICEGLIRVWRNWLAEQVCFETNPEKQPEREKRLLWSDPEKHVGLRMNVVKKDDVPEPVMHGADEDPPVSYTLQYEELVVRTSQLLLVLEKSLHQEINNTSKVLVIGSWAS